MEKRIGVVGIVIDSKENISRLNNVLSEYSHVIMGRMGLPNARKDLSVIALIVDGTTDELGALSGKIGNIKGIEVKTALTRVVAKEE